MTRPDARHPQRTAGAILERMATGPGGRQEAVRFGAATRDYQTLRRHALAFANALHTLGIRRGDRVAVLMRNRLEWVEVFFGLGHLGAVCVPVNVLLGAVEAEQQCHDADVRAFVVDGPGAEIVAGFAPAGAPVVVVEDESPGRSGGAAPLAYRDLLTASSAPPRSGPLSDDLAILYYTSGTTGLPKGSMHTHEGLLWNSYHQIVDLGVRSDDSYLVVPSLSWAAGLNDLMLATLWRGGRVVLMPTGSVTAESVLDHAARHRTNRALIVPTLLKEIAANADLLSRLRSSPLRLVLTGAEPVSVPVLEALQDAAPDVAVTQGYGLSEFPTIATVLSPEEAVSHVGTAGRPTSITRVALKRDDGSIVQHGEGEILLHSLATMRGYWQRPAETREALEDGWLHTGDLGRVDDEGFLTITGRCKDLIISGGLNIYPAEVERIIEGFPGVEEVAVVGASDQRWGEVPVAVVVGGAVDADALAAHCTTRLSKYKVPRVVVQERPLPRSAVGKLLRREVRKLAEAARDESRSAAGDQRPS